MALKENSYEQLNVVILAAALAITVIAASLILLWLINGNFYMDVYYIIETFFDAGNINADVYLSQAAASYATPLLAGVTAIVVIDNLSRVLIISFILAAVFDIVAYSNLEDKVNRMSAKRISGHVIVCGYNQVSQELIRKLKSKHIKFVVLEPNPDSTSALSREGINVINADSESKQSLLTANISKARAVVFTSNNDLDNIVGAISARSLSKSVNIICRATKAERAEIMKGVGANECIMPEYLIGNYLGRALSGVPGRKQRRVK